MLKWIPAHIIGMLLLAAILFLSGYGVYGLYVCATERAPATIECAEFLRDEDAQRWVVLKNAELDLREAIKAPLTLSWEDEAYFVPIRPPGGKGKVNVVLEVRSPQLIKRIEAIAAKPTELVADNEAIVAGQFAGLTESDAWRGEKTSAAIATRIDVTHHFRVLRQDAKPEFFRPLAALIVAMGLLALIVFRPETAGRQTDSPPV